MGSATGAHSRHRQPTRPQILLTLLGGLVLSSGVSEADGYNVRGRTRAVLLEQAD